MLGRRTLVRDEIRVDRLEHQPLGGGHLPQPREVLRSEHAEVGVGQQAALERPLAYPDDIGGEVGEARAQRSRSATPGLTSGRSPVSTSSSLTRWREAARSRISQHLLGRVQMRPVGGECAVLAVAAARPRQRQREVPAERDRRRIRIILRRPDRTLTPPRDAPPPLDRTCCCFAVLVGRVRHRRRRARPQGQRRDAGARLHPERDPRRDLLGAGPRRSTPARASTSRCRPRRRRPTRSSCCRPARPTSRSSTSTIWRSPASAASTSSASWRSSSAPWRR